MALLRNFEEYETYSDYIKSSPEDNQEKTNALFFLDMKAKIDEMSGLPLIDVEDPNSDVMRDRKGAVVYRDWRKHQMLSLPKEGDEIEIYVLSMGFFPDGKDFFAQPCITISDGGKPTCYLLPKEFESIVHVYLDICYSGFGYKPFPSFARISFDGTNYTFDLIEK